MSDGKGPTHLYFDENGNKDNDSQGSRVGNGRETGDDPSQLNNRALATDNTPTSRQENEQQAPSNDNTQLDNKESEVEEELDPNVEIVEEDKDGNIMWIEEFTIHRWTGHNDSKIFSGKVHRYKGADFTILFTVDNFNNRGIAMNPCFNRGAIGLFLGWNLPTARVPEGYRRRLHWYYELVDENGNPLCPRSKDDHNTFELRSVKRTERYDFGSWTQFPFPPSFVNAKDRLIGPYTFRVKILMREIFLPKLMPFGYNSKQATNMVGLENLGATCYLNSLLQMLFHLNSFRRLVYDIPYDGEHLKSSTTLALQNIFRNLQQSGKEVTTKQLTMAFGWTSAEAFLQQDIQEMLRVLLDKLEEKTKGSQLDGQIRTLFCGTIRSFIRCVNVQFESKREEDFYDVQLDVKGCQTIYDSFRKYVEMELLAGENQYDAGEQYGKQDAKKGVIFTKFPPVLTIHLKRFDFDYSTMGFIKIHDAYEFPTQLDLDEFLAPEEEGNNGNGHSRVPNRYILHSVLVHSGDVGGGHYYAYIRPSTTHNYQTVYNIQQMDTAAAASAASASANADSGSHLVPTCAKDKDKEWYKFNDETVLQVESYEANEYCYGRRPGFNNNEGFTRGISSAYMLVYIRETEAPQIMAPIVNEDIAAGLIQQLDQEVHQLAIEERKTLRQKLFTSIYYATEKEIRNFDSYHKQDLIQDEDMLVLPIFQQSKHIGVHIKLAEKLQVSPANIRLWVIDTVITPPNNTVEKPLRVTFAVDGNGTSKHSFSYSKVAKKNARYFVERREDVIDPMEDEDFDVMAKRMRKKYGRSCFQDDEHGNESKEEEIEGEKQEEKVDTGSSQENKNNINNDNNEHNRNETKEKEEDENEEEEELEEFLTTPMFNYAFTVVHGNFLRWLNRLRVALGKYIDRVAVDELLEQCGIGMTQKLLSELKSYNPADEHLALLEKENLLILKNTMKLFREYFIGSDSLNSAEEELLVFVKIFDPLDRIRVPVQRGCQEVISLLTEQEEKEEQQKMMTGENKDTQGSYRQEVSAVEVGLDDPEVVFVTEDIKPYCPVKYLGYFVTDLAEVNSPYQVVNELLGKVIMDRLDPKTGLQLMNHHGVIQCNLDGTNNEFGPLTYPRSTSILQLLQHGDMFIIKADPDVESKLIPPSRYNSVEPDLYSCYQVWHKYQTVKRFCLVSAMDSRDLKILYKLHKQGLLTATASGNNTNASAASTSSASASSAAASASPTATSQGQREGDITVVISQKKRKLSTEGTPSSSAALVMPSSSKKQHQTSQQQPPSAPQEILQGFTCALPNYARLQNVIRYIGEKLHIHCDYLSIALVPISLIDSDMYYHLHQIRWFALNTHYHDQQFVSMITSTNSGMRLSTYTGMPYHIIYRILPFSTQGLVKWPPVQDFFGKNPVTGRDSAFIRNSHRAPIRCLDFIIADERIRRYRRFMFYRALSAAASTATTGYLELGSSMQKLKKLKMMDPEVRTSVVTSDGTNTTTVTQQEGGGIILNATELWEEDIAFFQQLMASLPFELQWPEVQPQSSYELIDIHRINFVVKEDEPVNPAPPTPPNVLSRIAGAVGMGSGLGGGRGKGMMMLEQRKPHPLHSMMDDLRQALGIPAMLHLLPQIQEKLQVDTSNMTIFGVPVAEIVHPSETQQTQQSTQPMMLCDNLRPTTTPLHQQKPVILYQDCSDLITYNAEEQAIRPAFPLAICSIIGNVIVSVQDPHTIIRNVPYCWPEVRCELANYIPMTIQHIDPQEIVFMHNAHPTIRSMIISVFNFTLIGNVVRPCDCYLFNGPFLTYLREDDDYESLLQRLHMMMGGEKEALRKLRLAIVDEKNIPSFIPRPANLSSQMKDYASSSAEAMSAASVEGVTRDAVASGVKTAQNETGDDDHIGTVEEEQAVRREEGKEAVKNQDKGVKVEDIMSKITQNEQMMKGYGLNYDNENDEDIDDEVNSMEAIPEQTTVDLGVPKAAGNMNWTALMLLAGRLGVGLDDVLPTETVTLREMNSSKEYAAKLQQMCDFFNDMDAHKLDIDDDIGDDPHDGDYDFEDSDHHSGSRDSNSMDTEVGGVVEEGLLAAEAGAGNNGFHGVDRRHLLNQEDQARLSALDDILLNNRRQAVMGQPQQPVPAPSQHYLNNFKILSQSLGLPTSDQPPLPPLMMEKQLQQHIPMSTSQSQAQQPSNPRPNDPLSIKLDMIGEKLKEHKDVTIYERALYFYPAFAQENLRHLSHINHASNFVEDKLPKTLKYPFLGIQRSAADVQAARQQQQSPFLSKSNQNQFSTGIKIV